MDTAALRISLLIAYILLPSCATMMVMDQYPPIPNFVSKSPRRIAIREIGSGVPIVVLAGGPAACGKIYWDSLKKLSKTNRLIFWDYRSCGQSDRRKPYSIESDLQDLKTVITELRLQSPILLGHSYGGMLALKYTIKNPEKVRGLILVNTISSSEVYPESNLKKKRYLESLGLYEEWKKLGDLSAEGNASAVEQKRYWELELNNHLVDKSLIPKVLSGLEINFEALVAMQPDLSEFDIKRDVDSVTQPVLITVGKKDIIVLDEPLKLHNLIPQSTLVSFSHSGHMPFVDENKNFLATVETWLTERSFK
jgi:proline iminopeptidase